MNFQFVRSQLRKILRRLPLPRDFDGVLGIKLLGYKHFVGGLWDAVGRLQFEFLKSEGLSPEHWLLDIGCGPLRGGRFFIAYLESGHYIGLDKEKILVGEGLARELPRALLIDKKPQFVITEKFDFSLLPNAPDYAIAHSLFTHLSRQDIVTCLKNLRKHVIRCRLYATFFEGDSENNPAMSHSLNPFFYSQSEMKSFADESGWSFRYVGEWNHPRGQMMAEYRAG